MVATISNNYTSVLGRPDVRRVDQDLDRPTFLYQRKRYHLHHNSTLSGLICSKQGAIGLRRMTRVALSSPPAQWTCSRLIGQVARGNHAVFTHGRQEVSA